MANVNWPDESIFRPFDVVETQYKSVHGHSIKTAILTPKTLPLGTHPLIINIHGGLFAAGHSLFAPFWPTWVLDLAIQDNAIILSPDYRLLPTVNGILDIYADLEDFWTWLWKQLPDALQKSFSRHSVDYSKILLVGTSTGGYGAVQLALSHPDDIAAVALVSAVVDLKDEIFVHGPRTEDPAVFRFPPDQLPSLRESLSWIVDRKRAVRSKAGFEAMFFCASLMNHGAFEQGVLGHLDTQSLPLEIIKADGKMPHNVWIMQGTDDSVVPLRQTDAFYELLRTMLPHVNVRYDVAEGQDHAFEVDERNWTDFKASAMSYLEKRWLG